MPAVDLVSLSGLILAVSAVVIGIAKTSVGGFATLSVAAFALVMPAKESTAAVLLLLIVGDVVAIARNWRNANWGLLRRIFPSVLPGVALGALFMALVDDHTLKRAIGVLLTISVLIQLVLHSRRRGEDSGPRHPHLAMAIGAGTAAGFTTMTANAGGPVMTLYLLAARVDKHAFVGTNAWFFFLVNVSKAPFSLGLGLFPASTLMLTLMLAPFVLAGTWLGTKLVHRLSQQQFEIAALLASVLAAVSLLIR